MWVFGGGSLGVLFYFLDWGSWTADGAEYGGRRWDIFIHGRFVLCNQLKTEKVRESMREAETQQKNGLGSCFCFPKSNKRVSFFSVTQPSQAGTAPSLNRLSPPHVLDLLRWCYKAMAKEPNFFPQKYYSTETVSF